MKLLVVDSDRDNVDIVTGWLRMRGNHVQHANTVERMQKLWLETRPDVVIIDPEKMGADSFAMCDQLRATHNARILVVSRADGELSEATYLARGAEGFLAKPFEPRKLLASLTSLGGKNNSRFIPNPLTVMTVGPLRIDNVRHEVTRGKQVIRLTPTESRLLRFLATNANDICTLDQIVSHVWGGLRESSDGDLIYAHIRHLREKIEPEPGKPQFILTSTGLGYMLKRQVAEPGTLADAEASERAGKRYMRAQGSWFATAPASVGLRVMSERLP
jgi:DNA-binding response OmpR family regulator